MWNYTKDGKYSVKSGYYEIKNWERQTSTCPSSSDHHNKLWDKIWLTNNTPRQKTLVWKIL